MAVLAAFDIARDTALGLRPEQLVCYAVAAPRVGNHSFAQLYDRAVPHTWNVINDQVSHFYRCVLYSRSCYSCSMFLRPGQIFPTMQQDHGSRM